jgi:hypothetical protein
MKNWVYTTLAVLGTTLILADLALFAYFYLDSILGWWMLMTAVSATAAWIIFLIKQLLDGRNASRRRVREVQEQMRAEDDIRRRTWTECCGVTSNRTIK